MNSIIEINKISKKYRIAHQREKYVALRDVLANIAKKPLSVFKDRTSKSSTKEDFWALKDISFKVKEGEALGIIGPNGAGKTTLLKILSRITPPTKGEIKLRGRTASLLEVGTGFHPELTGRENIFLNGAILGMSKAEIKEKFDEIVAFSGIKKFLDTPVKRYSSGMFVRLAFAVAAHLEPEILLIDEVLAVGDAEFQKKCLGKMEDITKKSGRTILFVSHNMAAIQNLCDRCILLDQGKIKMIGKVKEVVEKYLSIASTSASKKLLKDYKQDSSKIKVLSIELKNGIENKFCINWDQPLIEVVIEIEVREKIKEVCFDIGIRTVENVPLFLIRHNDSGDELWDLEKGRHKIRVSIENVLRAGLYNIALGAYSSNRKNPIFGMHAAQLEVSDISAGDKKYLYHNWGIINANAKWNLIN